MKALFLLFFLSGAAWAENCPRPKGFVESDFHHEFGPIRDQDSIGWCFGFGGADQLGHWLFTHKMGPDPRKPKNMISAAQSGVVTYHDDSLEALGQYQAKMRFLKDGTKPVIDDERGKQNNLNIRIADLELLRERGKASEIDRIEETALRQESALSRGRLNFRYFLDQGYPVDKIDRDQPMSALTTLQKMIDFGLCRESEVSSLNFAQAEAVFDLKTVIGRVDSYMKDPGAPDAFCLAVDSMRQVLPGLPLREIIDALKNFESVDPLISGIREQCQPQKFAEKKRPEAVHIPKGKGLLKEVSRLVGKGVPVGLSFKSSILEDPDAKLSGSHYALVVGQRYDCESRGVKYLIRNSWGPNACEHHLKQIQKKRAGKKAEAAADACRADCVSKADARRVNYSSCLMDCAESDFGFDPNAAGPPPFECEEGNFLVPESLLKRGAAEGDGVYLK